MVDTPPIDPLPSTTPIVDENGKPTEFFQRKWAGQGEVNASNEDLAAQILVLQSQVAALITRVLTAGTGLDGGGDLSADRTFDMANTAVTPGPYTNSDITIDAQGRITAAANGSAAVANLNDIGDVNVPAPANNDAILFDTVSAKWIISNGIPYATIQDVSAANKLLGRDGSGSGVIQEINLSAAGRALIDDADAAAQRVTLNVDVAGTDNSTDVTLGGSLNYLSLAGQVLTPGAIDLDTDVSGTLPIASGGTGAQSAAAARTNLGLGTAAVEDIGTSGANVPLLDGANTHSAQNTFSDKIVSDDVTNSTSTTTGAIQTDGGIGLAKSLYCGGDITITGTIPMVSSGVISLQLGKISAALVTSTDCFIGAAQGGAGPGVLSGDLVYVSRSDANASHRFFTNNIERMVIAGGSGRTSFPGGIDTLAFLGNTPMASSGGISLQLGGINASLVSSTDSFIGVMNTGGPGALSGDILYIPRSDNPAAHRFFTSNIERVVINKSGEVFLNLPTTAGAAGSLWNDSGTVKVA